MDKVKPGPHANDESFEQTQVEDAEVLQSAVDMLAARFDTVQVFVSRVHPTSSETMGDDGGWGNWFARLGQTRAWLDLQAKSDNSEED